MEKKKHKKKSMTKQIRELKERYKENESWGQRGWKNFRRLQDQIHEIRKVFPEKYFKVKFKIKSNSGFMVESEEIKENFTLNLAIEDIKSNKTHPDTFELIDVKVLN